MSWLNTSSRRAPNRSQRSDDGFFEYETRPAETIRDMGFDMSQDGLRGLKTAINVGLKRRKVRPTDLVDMYGEWIPLAGEVDGAAEESGTDFQAETGEKRHRYESSVRGLPIDAPPLRLTVLCRTTQWYPGAG
jgi:hypothetical protein